MSWSNPGALWGLLLLLVPILVHLFSFRTSKRVLFSNLSFLKEIKEESRRKSQLKHLLVLMSRLLAITLLVLAFAQPQFGGKQQQEGSTVSHHAVFIDNSPSMGLQGAEGVLLEQAKTAARSLALASRPDDRFQLISHELSPLSQRWLSRDVFLDAIDGLQITDRSNAIDRILERQKDLIYSSYASNKSRLYWLSDFQKTVSPLTAIPAEPSLPLQLLQFNAGNQANLYVDSCWLLQPMLRPKELARLVFVIRNGGNSEAKGVRVSLRIDEAQKGLSTIDLPARGMITDTIDFTLTAAGNYRAVLSLDDRDFPYDNQWYMQLKVQDQLPLLHISSGSHNRYLKALFENDNFVLYQQESENRLDYNAISAYNAIFYEVKELPSSGLIGALESAVAQGASLVLLPAEGGSPEAFNQLLATFGGGTFGAMVEAQEEVAEINVQDKLFQETFSFLPERLSLPKLSKYYHYQPLADDRVIMRLRNKMPWLVRRAHGEGNLLFMGSVADQSWTDLPVNALFVPVFYRAALLSGQTQALAYRLGQDERIQVPADKFSNRSLISLRNQRQEYVPEVRRQGNRLLLDIRSGELSPGHYQIFEDGRAVAGKSVALNADLAESILSYWSEEELEQLSEQKGWQQWQVKKAEMAGQLQIAGQQSQLWKWLLLLVLIFLLTETLLIKYLP
jgi:hypothetical protein